MPSIFTASKFHTKRIEWKDRIKDVLSLTIVIVPLFFSMEKKSLISHFLVSLDFTSNVLKEFTSPLLAILIPLSIREVLDLGRN